MPTILENYRQKFRKSEEFFKQGRSVIAGGEHLSRPVNPFPVYVDHGQGSLKWDVDGNEIVDYMMGYGALIAGHSHPKIAEAVRQRLSQGTHMGAATPPRNSLGTESQRFHPLGRTSQIYPLRRRRHYDGHASSASLYW